MSFAVAGQTSVSVSDVDVEQITREILAKVTEASQAQTDPSHPLVDPALRAFLEMELSSLIERRLRCDTKSSTNKM